MLMAGNANILAVVVAMLVLSMASISVEARDENPVFQPCADAKIKRSDGFTFGIAFTDRDSFFFNGTQLSPCDSRLSLANKGAQLALFRPKVDEISLLTINTTTSFAPVAHWCRRSNALVLEQEILASGLEEATPRLQEDSSTVLGLGHQKGKNERVASALPPQSITRALQLLQKSLENCDTSA